MNMITTKENKEQHIIMTSLIRAGSEENARVQARRSQQHISCCSCNQQQLRVASRIIKKHVFAANRKGEGPCSAQRSSIQLNSVSSKAKPRAWQQISNMRPNGCINGRELTRNPAASSQSALSELKKPRIIQPKIAPLRYHEQHWAS